MKMRMKGLRGDRRKFRVLASSVAGGLLFGVHVTSAATVSDGVCMQQTYGGSTVTSANQLNCTANDIAISKVQVLNGVPQVSPAACEENEQFDLTATFEVKVNATERYDSGFYFRIDGGDDARGPIGSCALTTLDVPPASGEPWRDLDSDYCGDFRTKGTFYVTITMEGVTCAGDGTTDCGGQQCLRLPYCTSWHNNRATLCEEETDAVPETKSKCKCDDTFTVPVTVTPASAFLSKTPKEALVTYAIKVRNEGPANADLTSLCDDKYGTILGDPADCAAGTLCPEITEDCTDPESCPDCKAATDCDLEAAADLAPDEEYDCEFSVLIPAEGSSTPVQDTVTGVLVDTRGREAKPAGSAQVTIHLPVPPQ